MHRVAAVLIALLTVPTAYAEDVVVFSTSFQTIKPSEQVAATIYQLDVPEQVLGKLGEGLPNTLAQAQAVALDRLASPDGQAMVERLKNGFGGVVQAWSHKIEKLPAILIDDRYVVYGVYDVDQALAIYREKIK